MINEQDAGQREAGLRRTDDLFTAICSRLEFKVLDAAIERYGAWEWAAFREHEQLVEYLILAVLETPGTARCAVEVWRGLDDSRRFGRSLVAKGSSSEWYRVAEVANRLLDDAGSLRTPLDVSFLNTAQHRGSYWSLPLERQG
jgi:hypothetical protein